MRNINFEKAIIILIIITGIFLSTYQFFYNRSLWGDEASLSLNIINRNHSELLKPLDYLQIAPILFLQIEKIFSDLIPNSEFGLRLFPLLSFWLSIFLFYKILRSIHLNYYAIIFSLSLFIFSHTLFYYSNEVKQYMSDVLVSISVYYFVLKKYENEKHKYYYLCFIGIISIFLSNTASITLFTAGLYLLFDIRNNKKKQFHYLTGLSIIWVSIFLLYYYLFIYNHPLKNFMTSSWAGLNCFMPINPFNIQFYQFLYEKGKVVIHTLFTLHEIGIILILTGIISLIRKRKTDIIILTMTPLTLHLLLSGFKLYPFETRLILYTFPSIIIICSFGINYLINIFFTYYKVERFRILAIFIPLLMIFYFYKNGGFPKEHSEIKRSLKFMEQHMEKKDKVYVSSGAYTPFLYYKAISFEKIDTNNIIYDEIILGKEYKIFREGERWISDSVDSMNYCNVLRGIKGRVWFLFTVYGDQDKKRSILRKFFSVQSKNPIQKFYTRGSDCYLYDNSNQ